MKILVVDDEQDVKILFQQRFRKEIKKGELDFVFAFSGEEALKTLQTIAHEAVLILSDINMPGMGGLEMVKEVRKLDSCADTKIVMISTESAEDLIEGVLADGANGYITKPFTPESIQAELSQYM